MNIPIAFCLHGQRFVVEYDDTLCATSDDRGRVYLAYNKIVLQAPNKGEPQPQSCVEQAFLHELVHGILHHMESKLYDDEKFVNQFANLLHQAIVTMEYPEKPKK